MFVFQRCLYQLAWNPFKIATYYICCVSDISRSSLRHVMTFAKHSTLCFVRIVLEYFRDLLKVAILCSYLLNCVLEEFGLVECIVMIMSYLYYQRGVYLSGICCGFTQLSAVTLFFGMNWNCTGWPAVEESWWWSSNLVLMTGKKGMN